MGRLRLGSILISISFLTMHCSRPLSGDVSKITIEIPKKSVLEKSAGTLSLPGDRKACFAINVTGPGIESKKGNACSPATGVIAGFVEPGQIINATVPKGIDRKLELYVFLQAAGQNLPCPAFSTSLSASQILNIYRVATAERIDLSADEATVAVSVDFPGVSQNLAVQLSLPAVCTNSASTGNAPGFGITAARGDAIGAGINLHARVGAEVGNQVLSGGTIKLYVRE